MFKQNSVATQRERKIACQAVRADRHLACQKSSVSRRLSEEPLCCSKLAK